MQEIFVIISIGIIYCFWKTNSVKLQKILLVSYGICVMAFSVYAKLDADIVIAFIIFLSGTVFALIISGCGIAENMTALSCVYIVYRMFEIDQQEYTILALWLCLTLVLMGWIFGCKNLNSIKLVKNLTNDINERDYSSHKTIEMRVGDISDMDLDSKITGVSASTKNQKIFKDEDKLRNDISKKLTNKREIRRIRRSRLRYREARFDNRVSIKKKV